MKSVWDSNPPARVVTITEGIGIRAAESESVHLAGVGVGVASQLANTFTARFVMHSYPRTRRSSVFRAQLQLHRSAGSVCVTVPHNLFAWDTILIFARNVNTFFHLIIDPQIPQMLDLITRSRNTNVFVKFYMAESLHIILSKFLRVP